jgi:hypothetical protein
MRSRILGEFIKNLVRLFPLAFLIAAFTNIAFAQYSSNLAEVEAYCLNSCSKFGRSGTATYERCKKDCRNAYYRPQASKSSPSYSPPAQPSPPSSGNASVDAVSTYFSLIENSKQLVKDEQESARQQREIERQDAQRAARQEELNAIKRKMEADRRASQPTPLPPAKSADDDLLVGSEFRERYKAFIDNKNKTSSSQTLPSDDSGSDSPWADASGLRPSQGAMQPDPPVAVSDSEKTAIRSTLGKATLSIVSSGMGAVVRKADAIGNAVGSANVMKRANEKLEKSKAEAMPEATNPYGD